MKTPKNVFTFRCTFALSTRKERQPRTVGQLCKEPIVIRLLLLTVPLKTRLVFLTVPLKTRLVLLTVPLKTRLVLRIVPLTKPLKIILTNLSQNFERILRKTNTTSRHYNLTKLYLRKGIKNLLDWVFISGSKGN